MDDALARGGLLAAFGWGEEKLLEVCEVGRPWSGSHWSARWSLSGALAPDTPGRGGPVPLYNPPEAGPLRWMCASSRFVGPARGRGWVLGCG